MYRRIGALFAVVLLMGMFISERAGASMWNAVMDSLEVKVVGDTYPAYPDSQCSTFRMQVQIESVGLRNACILGGPRSVVTYNDSGGYFMAASMSSSEKRFPVRGVCEGVMGCYYSPDGDVAAEVVFGAYPSKQLIVTRKVTESLWLRYDPAKLQFYFQYVENDRRSVRDTAGNIAPIESAGLSNNGRWLAVELRDVGTGLAPVSTLQLRRITDQAYRYNLGANPHQEMAVANDGSAVMVAGLNSGFNLMTVDDDCGELWNQSQWGRYAFGVRACPRSDMGIGRALPPGDWTYHRPSFIENAAIVQAKYQGVAKVLSIRPAGSLQMGVHYIALGDSFASGEGESDDREYQIGTNEPYEKCHISKRSYPYLIRQLGVRSVACSGARMGDILGNPQYQGQGDRVKQLVTSDAGALTSFLPGRVAQRDFVTVFQPSVITIGVGGNDAGLMQKVRSCAGLDSCDWAKPAQLEKTALEIRALFPKFVELYVRIQQDAPGARRYVIGYPDVVEKAGECGGVTGLLLNTEEREYLRRSIEYLNEVIAAAAHVAGVPFINLGNVFKEHALCREGERAAMNGIRFGDDSAAVQAVPQLRVIGNESFHPTPFGHTLMAAAITAQTQGLTTATCGIGCESPVGAPEPGNYWNVTPTPTRTLLANMTETHRNLETDTLQIELSDSPFRPESIVQASISPENVELGSLHVDERARLAGVLKLRAQLSEGSHILKVLGKTPTGENVETYQELVVTEDKPVVTSELAKKVSATGAMGIPEAIETHKEAVGSNDFHSALIGKAPPSPESTPKQVTDSILKADTFMRIIAVGGGLTGIIVTCLILVRLSRK